MRNSFTESILGKVVEFVIKVLVISAVEHFLMRVPLLYFIFFAVNIWGIAKCFPWVSDILDIFFGGDSGDMDLAFFFSPTFFILLAAFAFWSVFKVLVFLEPVFFIAGPFCIAFQWCKEE